MFLPVLCVPLFDVGTFRCLLMDLKSQVCDTSIEMAAELREYYIVLHAAHIRLFSSYPALQSVLFWLNQKAKKWADVTRVTLITSGEVSCRLQFGDQNLV